MQLRNTNTQFGFVAKFFHWLVVILIILMLLMGFFMSGLGQLTGLKIHMIHKCLGVIVLFIMLLRLIWRVINPVPGYPASMSKLEQYLAQLMHWLLYATIILMSLSGWIMASASRRPPIFFSWSWQLPIPKNATLAGIMHDIHIDCAWVVLGLICLHTLAALKHHFINKDDILKRML